MNKKIIALGMDGFIVPLMKRFAAEGALPNFERMLKQGTVNQTRPSFPVWTPTNWATLSTGAHTGTHGASRWRVELESGRRIDSFNGQAVNADRIWNALERAGLKSVAVHYPAAHPSGVRAGYVIDGFGHPVYANTDYEVAAAQAYTTDVAPGSKVIGAHVGHDGTAIGGVPSPIALIPPLHPARDWSNVPPSQAPPLATSIEIHSRLVLQPHIGLVL